MFLFRCDIIFFDCLCLSEITLHVSSFYPFYFVLSLFCGRRDLFIKIFKKREIWDIVFCRRLHPYLPEGQTGLAPLGLGPQAACLYIIILYTLYEVIFNISTL
jgi:hypothetical protein